MPIQRHSDTRRIARRGFTLLEVIVVVTIIALLATLVAPRVFKQLTSGQSSVAQSEAASIAKTVQMYMVDNGMSMLNDDFDLTLLTTGSDPYIDRVDGLLDPWDNPYQIIIPGDKHVDFDVISWGPDGEQGTEDDIVHK